MTNMGYGIASMQLEFVSSMCETWSLLADWVLRKGTPAPACEPPHKKPSSSSLLCVLQCNSESSQTVNSV